MANLLQDWANLFHRQTLGGFKLDEFRQTQFEHLEIKANNVVVDKSIIGSDKVEPVGVKLSQVFKHGHLEATQTLHEIPRQQFEVPFC